MAARSCSTPRAVFLIGRGVGIELLRRNAFYVISIIVGLYLIGVILVRLVGVGVSNLTSDLQQLSLFDHDFERERELLKAIDDLQERFGADIIRKGPGQK